MEIQSKPKNVFQLLSLIGMKNDESVSIHSSLWLWRALLDNWARGSPLWINDGWWWRKLCHNMLGNAIFIWHYLGTVEYVFVPTFLLTVTLPCAAYKANCVTTWWENHASLNWSPLLAWAQNLPIWKMNSWSLTFENAFIWRNQCCLGPLVIANSFDVSWSFLRNF